VPLGCPAFAPLVAAATLSHRYIADRFLPDKAIDLMDEAASRLRIENDTMPQELDGIRRRMMQLEIEGEALKKEKETKLFEFLTAEQQTKYKSLMEKKKTEAKPTEVKPAS